MGTVGFRLAHVVAVSVRGGRVLMFSVAAVDRCGPSMGGKTGVLGEISAAWHMPIEHLF
jgi:hypothetical protein